MPLILVNLNQGRPLAFHRLAQRRLERQGRIDIVREVLVRTPAVVQLIRSGKEYQLPTVMQTGAALGMRTMEQALRRCGEGGTS